MIHAVIMAGGKGTRFWPLSRARKAKQFLSILGDDTLIEQTIVRIRPVVDCVWVVGTQAQAEFFDALPDTAKPDHLLLEPVGKNTAPCIGWAASKIKSIDPDGIMVVLPSDHTIQNPQRFHALIEQAIQIARSHHHLITLGIKPTHPHTGYGYIEAKRVKHGVGSVVRFREKPNYDTAVGFIQKKRFFWNSGIFVWRAQQIFSLIQHHIPSDAEYYEQLATLGGPSLKAVYRRLQSISIDYAVMENATHLTSVLIADMGWDDIGSWSALDAHWPKDKQGNASKRPVIALDATGNIVYASKLVTLLDVHDLVVVETPDAILVTRKASDQRIRELTEKLPSDYQ